MSFKLAGLQKTTFIDYPEKIACIVFTQGCNFRCGYCHNPELFENKEPLISLEAFFDFLKKRQGKLDGVVVTGGEPTLQKDLKEFIKNIKELGFAVKLDTNGTNPQILEELINEKLLDYIAMDIKAPIDKYEFIVNCNVNIENIKKSINLIKNSCVNYEFRTTVLKSQLSYDDFEKIGEMISGTKRYYMQKFIASKILDKNLMNEKTYSDEEFEEIKNILKKNIDFVEVR